MCTVFFALAGCADTPPDSDADQGDTSVAETTGTDLDSERMPAPGVFVVDGIDTGITYDDLLPLKAMIGDDVEYVALGESIHTSHGYYQSKLRLIQFLVEEMGYRSVAFESPWTDADRAANYVASCESSPAQAIRGLFSVWQDVAVAELLQWMCEWNRAHSNDPVHFFGFDVQQPWHDGPALRSFVERIAPDESEDMLVNLDSCNGVLFESEAAYYNDPEMQQLIGGSSVIPEGEHQNCVETLADIRTYIDDNESRIRAAVGDSDLAWGRIAVTGVESWQQQTYLFSNGRDGDGFEARDRGMAYVLEEIRRLRHPNTKTIVWAHNTHIAEDLPNADTAYGSVWGMGTLLKARLGGAYYAIALIGYDVEINWGRIVAPAEPVAPDAVERILNDFDEPYILVDLAPPEQTPFFDRTEYQLQGERMVPSEQFEALFFLAHSPAAVYVCDPSETGDNTACVAARNGTCVDQSSNGQDFGACVEPTEDSNPI